jgi:transposase-like protein
MDCPARGQTGIGNIQIHSQREQRYRCIRCGKTFSESKGTALYGLKKEPELFVTVTTLLAHGCPTQAVVAAYGLDERTVRKWLLRAGGQCQRVHAEIVGKSKLDLEQVQADEIKVKTQGGSAWMAMALMVRTRLWLGGVISPKRDMALIVALVSYVRAIALCRPLLLAVDGLASYVSAFQAAFRSPLPTGKRGRPTLVPWPDIAIVQVVKKRTKAAFSVQRRIVQGTSTTVSTLLTVSQGVGVINTAFIERLNATFRQRLACLARRSRALPRSPDTLSAAMFLLGTVYNFCTDHQSLRLPLLIGSKGHRHWVSRTPALAAGLTDHRWSMLELLTFKVPPPPLVPPKRRGRPPKSISAQPA